MDSDLSSLSHAALPPGTVVGPTGRVSMKAFVEKLKDEDGNLLVTEQGNPVKTHYIELNWTDFTWIRTSRKGYIPIKK